MDSTRISAGPLAVARLPFRMKNGLHGNWADASQTAGHEPALTESGTEPRHAGK